MILFLNVIIKNNLEGRRVSVPKISIVVPVYNVEKYLNRCVESILKQTVLELEVILVDDGSTDSSPQICDQWAETDHRIKVVHKANGGLSSARNAGMDVAGGDYIGFVDSDDWVASDMYELLLHALVRHDADYAAVEMKIVKNEKQNDTQPQYKEIVLDEDGLFRLFFRVSDDSIHYCVCDKLFKKSTLKNLRFKDGLRFEDLDFNFRFLCRCHKGVLLNQKKYYWFYNHGSITRNCLVFEDIQILSIWLGIIKKCNKSYPQYVYFARMNYERAFLGLLGKAVKFGVSKEYINWNEDKRRLLKSIRNYFIDLMKWRMPFSRKLLLCMVAIRPELAGFIFCFIKKIWNGKILWRKKQRQLR